MQAEVTSTAPVFQRSKNTKYGLDMKNYNGFTFKIVMHIPIKVLSMKKMILDPSK